MSKKKISGNEFTNEHTVRRRAWIAKALDSVRGRFDSGDIELRATEEPAKPQLFVVKSEDQG